MRISYLILILPMISCVACTPILTADFDAIPEGNYFNQVVDLPGSPDGDRMIVKNHVQVADPSDNGDHALWIFRNVFTNTGSHSEIYLDPIAANSEDSIYFSWNGTIVDTQASGNDVPVVALKLRNLVNADQPNLFSKLVIRYGPEKITVQNHGANEISIGNGVTGSHKVVLRIDYGHKFYAFSINGEGVNPNGGITHTGTLSQDVTIDPANIGLTLTFDDEINNGVTSYVVNNVLVSERKP